MADKAVSDLTAASALNDADLLLITQSATSKKLTGAALKTYAQDGFTVSSSSTLTNKTVNLTNNVLSGTLAQFNTALSDADFVTIAGAETLTGKSLTTPILTATASGTTAGRLGYLSGALTFGDGTTQQSILTTVGNTWTLANSTTLSAASTKTLTLNGGGGTNGLVLDASNNVGIGVAPTYRLDVANNSTNIIARLSSAYVYGTAIQLANSSTGGGTWTLYSFGQSNGEGAGNFGIANISGNKLTLDSSGNLGLGVTPSAWVSSFAVTQYKGGAIGSSASTNLNISQNAYLNSSGIWTYVSSSFASKYNMDSGGHSWFTAPSGTAGNAISFTQAMTLDAGGNLLVGATSQNGKLTIGSTAVGNNTIYQSISNGSGSIIFGVEYSTGGSLAMGSSGYAAVLLQQAAYSLQFGTSNTVRATIDSSGRFLVGVTTTADTANIFQASDGAAAYGADAYSFTAANSAACCFKVGSKTTGRSINAKGTINASGADYAEYMTKAGDFEIAKGDVCGINTFGLLTNAFSEAVSFVVKSTDPSYVGNDSWGAEIEDKDVLETERQKVDRIAFSGQVPVNVFGAKAGDYIVPVSDADRIKGEAVSNPTFEQYQIAVGKVIAIESDGRAKIIVKVA